MKNILVVEDIKNSKPYDKRYLVIDKDTGEVLDNAQGYGYKTVQKAYAAYGWKHRDKSKDNERQEKERQIKHWLKEHKDFAESMEIMCFEILKGSWGPDVEFDAKFVKQMLKDSDLKPNFSAGELLKVWRKL